jgi:coenzyme F420-0:L-glutamate ligase/coenzyme F420-1:gamma-L-glutamate ligase
VTQVTLTTLPGIPLVAAGDDLAGILLAAVAEAGLVLADGDIFIVAQKIVSKAEGRMVDLASVTPSTAARALALEVDKDPRITELILRESTAVVRRRPGVLIVRHRGGWVGANAGIDQSNVASEDEEKALLLPLDADASAARLRAEVHARTGVNVGVVINDSMGRPWRLGTQGLAIGSAGITALEDRRGDPDIFGRILKITMIARADELAAAGSLLMGQADERSPVVHVRGLPPEDSTQGVRDLMRPAADDLFR